MHITRKRHNTLVRQKQIISAMRKLIVKYGSEHVTIRRIAKEIGVTEGAIYKHFTSKREALSFLIDDIERKLIGDIEKNYPVYCATVETLEKIISSHLSAIEQRKGVSFQVIAEIISLGDKKLNKKINDVINRYTAHIRNILSEGVTAKVIRQDIDLDATATLFFGMTQGLVNMWALSNYGFNLEERYAPMWTIFRETITKRKI